MPASGAASTMRRTIAAPARCPADRERPWRMAHRPLPSMMMPTWIPALCSIKLLRKKKGEDYRSRVARISASMCSR
jgi:hypothetical protein